MTPQRNKYGTLTGQTFDETRFDLQKTVVPGLVQMGRSQAMHGRADDADWWPVYALATDLP
ncbi:hypothetical protein [uncultured Shimia sp.]|uniref:hypothetical protein n=1 Tax=uncultured Shimia sp. TaxID=573152 RepID=UPI0026109DFC|nr:hypothetical protein [uncultured Shimia sp.]